MYAFGMMSAMLRDRKAISSMEYAILAAVILGAVGAAASALGTDITNLFTALENIVTKYTPS